MCTNKEFDVILYSKTTTNMYMDGHKAYKSCITGFVFVTTCDVDDFYLTFWYLRIPFQYNAEHFEKSTHTS